MKIKDLHNHFLKSTGICTDTRNITEGCLFFALKGENFNGNKFADEALKNGAYKVVIDEITYHKNTGKTILCANTLRMLQKVASYHREYLNLPIIAITGSNGKTTTKELINAVLTQKFKSIATKGNLNNHIGVPLTLLSMDSETEIGIVELGANHFKEIEKLCEIVQPNYGYISNFGLAHLEGFGSIQGVIKAKTELYKYLKENNKTVFLNANDPDQVLYSKSLSKVSFGNEDQDCHIQLVEASNTLIIRFDNIEFNTNLIGVYNFHNIAAAICMGVYFGVPSKKIKAAIEGYVPTNNRSQLIKKNNSKIILDAYNANPTSMMAALESFEQLTGNDKVLFLGDMFELGHDAKKEHQKIVNYLEEKQLGAVYLIGINFFNTNKKAKHIQVFDSFEKLKENIAETSFNGKTILIKASRGMALERILELI